MVSRLEIDQIFSNIKDFKAGDVQDTDEVGFVRTANAERLVAASHEPIKQTAVQSLGQCTFTPVDLNTMHIISHYC